MGFGRISNNAETAGWRRDMALVGPRGTLGATMLYHGVEKLRAPEESARQFESLGIKPSRFWSRVTALAETSAGLLMIAGWLVRPAALAVLVTQAAAIKKVHAPKGFATYRGGYEFNLGLMATAAAMLLAGPGRYSLAGLLRRAVEPRGWRRWAPRRRRAFLPALLDALS
jgi:putative oxidoreductase